MQRHGLLFGLALSLFCIFVVSIATTLHRDSQPAVKAAVAAPARYWFMLERKSNKELLYKGVPGNADESTLIKTFPVKVGIPSERPTPLPQLVGRDYWNIIKKEPTDNPETGPYFLTLDVPTEDAWPYGPTPYLECDGQCDWVTVGYFGLHGVGGDQTRLSENDPGSSGCIRHKDADITYLYNLLHPQTEPIRYYVQDI